MLLTIDDIYSRLYEEVVNEISREETALVTRAITSAEQEARIYLSRYDLTQLFGTDAETPATFPDTFLKNLCVDIACWNLAKLAHPGVKYDHCRKCYEDAIATLKSIQKGQANPDWPYRETTGQTAPNGSTVAAFYSPRRRSSSF